MDTIVLKFGGSSVADNIKLNIVADKIIELYNQKEQHSSYSFGTGKNNR